MSKRFSEAEVGHRVVINGIWTIFEIERVARGHITFRAVQDGITATVVRRLRDRMHLIR